MIYFLNYLLLILGHNFGTADAPNKLSVYIFMSETCPICQAMTPELRSLQDDPIMKEYNLLLVFPNYLVSSDSTVNEFMKKYRLNLKYIVDTNQIITKKVGATITPEAIIRDENMDRTLYKGCVTDEYERVGIRKRTNINRTLYQVLKILPDSQNLSNFDCQAIGCFIIKQQSSEPH